MERSGGLGSEYRVQGSGFWVPGSGYQVQGSGHRGSGVQGLNGSMWTLAGVVCRVSNIVSCLFLPCFGFLVLDPLGLAPQLQKTRTAIGRKHQITHRQDYQGLVTGLTAFAFKRERE